MKLRPDINDTMRAEGAEGVRARVGAAKPFKANGKDACGPLTLNDWLDWPMPPRDTLMGALLSTTTRMLVIGPTGLGKTLLGVDLAIMACMGLPFLHWAGGRAARVLYIDGEMSAVGMKERLQDAVERCGGHKPEGLIILSREFHEDMPPLNTPDGQQYIDNFIEEFGPFDLIELDNIQALLVGDMKDEAQWAAVLPWAQSLTRRKIGQVWFHHTGHDESHSYGSKAREWQLDVVCLMERLEVPGADVAFTLTFTKARERRPTNRQDFETVTLTLTEGKWSYVIGKPVKAKQLGQNERVVLGLIEDAMPAGILTGQLIAKGKDLDVSRQRNYDARRSLKERKLIYEFEDRWFLTSR